MKIGIIVHSHTGNTYSVAQKLQEKLSEAGFSVNLERIIPDNENQTDIKKVKLNSIPDNSKYDALIFGSPVRGASISPALLAYLQKTQSLDGKKVACFVTEFFPFPWMGGNRAITKMKSICESAGAEICSTGIVNWSNIHRKKMISDLVEKLSSSF